MQRPRAFRRPFFRLAAFGLLAGVLAPPPPPARASAAAAAPIRGMVGVGTWATQAEFKDIKVTKGGRTLFSSDFSRGTRGWKTVRGKWEVVEGALRQTGNEEGARALIGDPAWSDYTLTLRARKLGGGEGFLILFGVPDASTRSWWNLGGWGNTGSAIEAPATSGDRVPVTLETGRWYDLRIELKGNTIRAYLDDRRVHTATQAPGIHTLVFSTNARGEKKVIPEWGLDTSWPDPNNMRRGLLYMGKSQVDIVRVAFPIDTPLVNGELSPAAKEEVDKRARIAVTAGDKPWTMMPHQEGGVHPWFKNGDDEVVPERWVGAMKAAQRRYGKKLIWVEPFNEPDYGWGQGTVGNLHDILGLLRREPGFAGTLLAGPSTLNSDAAGRWYQPIKSRLDIGTTHALGGSMETYINHYLSAIADRKRPYHPEIHNLAEVISGAHYGLQSAIWWGTAELARGEFVKAVQGERLAYAEDRPRWSAAAVYRAPGGKVQAFLGSSERQGETTTYRIVSRDRDVFFNGDGPRREFTVPVRRDTDILLDITWGQDVPPKVGGRYVIVNRHSGKVLGVAGANKDNGGAIQQMEYHRAAHQQWEVAPFAGPFGDQSYFTLRAVHSGKSLDTADRNHDEGGKIQQWGEGDAVPQHWYFDYAGDNFFYIRSRWSTKCLGIAGGSKGAGASVQQFSPTATRQQQWRLIPVSALSRRTIDFDAPRTPTGLTASAGPRSVALRWAADRDAADLAGYTVLRSTTRGGPYDTIARAVRGERFVDRGAKERRAYYYVVRAVDYSLNRSAFSAEAGATPAGSPARR